MSGTFNYDRAGVCQDQNTTYENQSEAQRNFQDAVFGDYGQCRPSGWFDVYIGKDDVISNTSGFTQGRETTLPNISGYVDGNGQQSDGTKEGYKYRAYINLDWESDNFGKIDESIGFANNTDWAGTVWQKWFSWGTVNEKDATQYDALLNHPNTKAALSFEMMNLKKWADFHDIPHEDVEKRLLENGTVSAEFLANTYKDIVDSGVDVSPLVDDGVITPKSVEKSGLLDPKTNENPELKKIVNDSSDGKNGGFESSGQKGFGEVEEILSSFDEAPKQFATAFGLPEGSIVTLKYPHDAVYGQPGIAGQDHIVIEQFQYKAPQEGILTGKDEPSYFTGLKRGSNLEEFIGIVKLPIPNNLNFSNGVSWGDSRLNAVEAAAFFNGFSAIQGALSDNSLRGLPGALDKDIKQIVKDIQNQELGGGSPANIALSSFLAQFALGRVGINVNAGEAITRGTGAAINPNLELLFNGPKLRNFQFSFNFAPNDELDGSIMRRIQKFFKMGMSPVRNSNNLLLLGSPNIFRLRYRTKERERIKGLPMHKICALTQCAVNYAPDNVYQSYEDNAAGSSPVRTVMNLSFTELTPIFQDDYLTPVEQYSSKIDETFGHEIRTFNNDYVENDLYNDDGDGSLEKIGQEDTGF